MSHNTTLPLMLCDAVCEQLNTQQFSQTLDAKRYYKPKFKLEQINELKVCVVPISKESQLLTRSSKSIETVIQVGILKKLLNPSNDNLDPLTFLVEELEDFLAYREILTRPTSTVIGTSINPIFDQDLLKDNSQFTSVLELTVRTFQ